MKIKSSGTAVPLGFMSQGETGLLVEIRGPRHHGHGGLNVPHAGPSRGYERGHLFHSHRGHRLEHRLNHMGLVPGAPVEVIRNNAPGPVIVAVKGTRICLGRGVANRVMVDPRGGGIPDAPAGGAGGD